MKRFEILEDAEYDRYLIFMYGENGSICGVNYHHGIGDLDVNYTENDPKLFKIYLERMAGKAEEDTRESIMRKSIEELRITTQDFSREYAINKVIETQMLIMAEKIFEKTYVGNTSLSDSEYEMIAMSQKALELIFNKIIENKHKNEN
jgi:hypothetical protein